MNRKLINQRTIAIASLLLVAVFSSNAQNIDSLKIEYEASLKMISIEYPVSCGCGNCAMYCVEKVTKMEKPSYEGFILWLRKKYSH